MAGRGMGYMGGAGAGAGAGAAYGYPGQQAYGGYYGLVSIERRIGGGCFHLFLLFLVCVCFVEYYFIYFSTD